MCGNDECVCQGPHEKHQYQPLKGLVERVSKAPKFEEELKREEKVMEELFRGAEEDIRRCRELHQRLMTAHIAKEFRFAEIRRKLMSGEKPLATELTGDFLGRMLEGLEHGAKVRVPYKFTGEKLVLELTNIRARFQGITEEVEKLWDFSAEVQ